MKRKDSQLDTIVKGGMLLTISSFISKFLSAIYKVPFQNLTGDEGFYVYQQIYPLYGLAVAFSLSGFPLFVSKIVSETSDDQELQEKLREVHTWLACIAFSAFLLLQFGAEALANWMGDAQLSPVIRSVSYFFLFLPMLAIARGYFQGQADMLPTGISQVLEQIIRVGILLFVAFYFPQSAWSFYEMGANAYHSAWLSALFATVVLAWFLNKNHALTDFVKLIKPKFSMQMGQRLLGEGLLLVVVGSLLILFQFIDSFTIFNALLDAGFSSGRSMSMKGIYDRGQPLIQLGMVVGSSLATTSLPLLRKQALAESWTAWRTESASILKFTTILAGAAAIGLMAVMPWMNTALFKDRAGTDVLQIMMLNVLAISLIYSLQTILQSVNRYQQSVFILLVGLGFKVLMNPLVTRNIGIQGSAMVTLLSLLIISVLMMQLTDGDIWRKFLANRFLLKIVPLLAGMYGLVYGLLSYLTKYFEVDSRIGNLALTLLGVAFGAAFYGIGIIKLKVLSEEEIEQLPLPERLKRINRK